MIYFPLRHHFSILFWKVILSRHWSTELPKELARWGKDISFHSNSSPRFYLSRLTSTNFESTICHSGVCSCPSQVCHELWDNQKQECALIDFSHLTKQTRINKSNFPKTLWKSDIRSLRNSGQILQGKREQLESDRGVPLGYILVGVVLNTPPRLHLAHIFPCKATLLRIQTHSLYCQVLWSSLSLLTHSSNSPLI